MITGALDILVAPEHQMLVPVVAFTSFLAFPYRHQDERQSMLCGVLWVALVIACVVRNELHR